MPAELVAPVEHRELYGIGIGYVDAQLLAGDDAHRRRDAVDPRPTTQRGGATSGCRLTHQRPVAEAPADRASTGVPEYGSRLLSPPKRDQTRRLDQ